jgi:hypothetical protein
MLDGPAISRIRSIPFGKAPKIAHTPYFVLWVRKSCWQETVFLISPDEVHTSIKRRYHLTEHDILTCPQQYHAIIVQHSMDR